MSSNSLMTISLILFFSDKFSLLETTSYSNQDSNQQQQRQQQSTSNGDSWQHWWSYDGISGPDYWSINNNWKLCESGMRQSPINLELDKLLFDPNLNPLDYAIVQQSTKQQQQAIINKQQTINTTNDQQTKAISGYLMNNGRGIEFFIDDPNDNSLIKSNWLNRNIGAARSIGDTKTTSGDELEQQQRQFYLFDGPLAYRYKLYKLELHASSSNSHLSLDKPQQQQQQQPPILSENNQATKNMINYHKTSEHTINDRQNSFVGELQLHFYNSQLYSNFDETIGKPYAYAAISIFLMMNSNNRFSNQSINTLNHQHHLDFVFENLRNISNKGSFMKLSLDGSKLMQLITTKDEYITYDGSLNRPPCSENVKWIILNKGLYIEQNEYSELFNQMLDGIDNIRPTKSLNRRLLRTSINFNQPTINKNCNQLDSKSSNKDCVSNREKNPPQTNAPSSKKRKKIELDHNHQQQSSFCHIKPKFTYQINEAIRELNLHSTVS